MISISLGNLLLYNGYKKYCKAMKVEKSDMITRNTAIKIASYFSYLEIALCIASIVIATQIFANTLPSWLQFLKDRVNLATGMEISAITALVYSALGITKMVEPIKK